MLPLKQVTSNVEPIAQWVSELKQRYGHCITGELVVPPTEGRFCSFPVELDQRLRSALNAREITRLYSHQARAWEVAAQRRDMVIVTPTASGKSLCYNLPVLHNALLNRDKALYLFPTKALSQDQVAEISALNQAAALGVRACTFDGDTPSDARKAVRTRGDIVVTNPDMLHQGILPHHNKWAQFFESLRFVVIDELHIYRGLFGSHVANLIRRLQRICHFYGSDPLYICCSATIGNAPQLAQQLLARPVVEIAENGAPRGARYLLTWNPPVVNAELGIRASARSQSVMLSRDAVKRALRTIVFAQSRLAVEVLTKYLKDAFDNDPRKPQRIRAYRGGYLPTRRRKTEKALRGGDVACVVATSALELGVDIGALDVAILNGYPGGIAASWQRFGRAGRRLRPAVGIVVAGSRALDQYVVQNPDYFFSANPEQARIAPDHALILYDHIRCAAFELPFAEGEHFGDVDPQPALSFLADQGVVHADAGRWHWIDESYPAVSVNLRSVADGNFVVVDSSDGGKKIIAEVDYSSAALTLYEGAIYMLESRPWQVERLDWEGRKAYVRNTEVDYYTDAIDYTRLKILEGFEQQSAGEGAAAHGEVHLVRRVTGYKKIRYYTHENIGYGPINLPDQEIHTCALWWRLSSAVLEKHFANRWQTMDGFIGAGYALHTVATLHSMSEHRDIGRAVGSDEGGWYVASGSARPEGRGRADTTRAGFAPTLFLYDNYPGGMAIAPGLFARQQILLDQAQQLIGGCTCSVGCPACVGPRSDAVTGDSAETKRSALTVIGLLSHL